MFRQLMRSMLAGAVAQEPSGCKHSLGIQGVHVFGSHGISEARVTVTIEKKQHPVQFLVYVGEGVEAHRFVGDDSATVVLEGIVVLAPVEPVLKRISRNVVISLVKKGDFTRVEIQVPRCTKFHVCNEMEPGETLPTVMPLGVAQNFAATFVTEEMVIALAGRLGMKVIPSNMMLVPKVPVQPRPAPIAEPPKVGKKTAGKKPAGSPRKVTHQKAPKPKPVPRIKIARKKSSGSRAR